VGALLSLFGVGFGIDTGYVILASIAVLTFVACVSLFLVIAPLTYF
jgi:hypothetical protein